MCCSGDDAKDASMEFKPASQRSCTDILMLLLYLVAWGGLIAILVSSAKSGGNPYKIINGVDYQNRVCGRDDGVKDLPYAAWPYAPVGQAQSCSECVSLMVCLASCNDTMTSNSMTLHYPSDTYVNFCIPNQNLIQGGVSVSFSFSGDFESAKEVASRAIASMLTAWPLILASGFAALIISFLYMYLARKINGVLVFIAIILVTVGGVLASIALLKAASEASNSSLTTRATAMKGVGITVAVCTGLFLLVVFFLRDRIKLAIEVVNEASRAMSDMKWMPFFPVFPFLFALAYFVLWIVTALFIFSVAKTSQTPIPSQALQCEVPGCLMSTVASGNYTKNELDQGIQGSFAYSFFHLLWTIQFLVYFCFMVIAGAVAQWYFSERDPSGNKKRGDGVNELSNSPIASSTYRTIRFHLGTVAFGALIIAIIQFMRAVVNYIEAKTHAAKGGMNPIQKVIFYLIKCCLYCLECCCDKISKNAFVWTAIWGDSFIPAACSSFSLIWNNLARTAALSVVSTYLIFLGKVMVALLSMGICGLIASRVYKDKISSPVMPMVVMFILSYAVAGMFMVIFETTVDTIFLCFLVDESKGGPRFAGPELTAVVNKHSAESKKYAEDLQALKTSRQIALGSKESVPSVPAGSGPAASAPAMSSTGTSYV